jgi:hypothetical protein
MPRVKLTKSVIDDLPTPAKDVVHWDAGCPGFGVKVTPAGRKVFVVLAKIHNRPLRPRHPSSSAGVGTEGLRRQA